MDTAITVGSLLYLGGGSLLAIIILWVLLAFLRAYADRYSR